MNILSFKLSIYIYICITGRTTVSKARHYCPITQWVERSNMKREHDVAKYTVRYVPKVTLSTTAEG